jgi:cytochrome P450
MSDTVSTEETDFDFHGEALDNIFDTYRDLRSKCPVGRSGKYGGFTYLMKSEDIFAAEQDPETFAVRPTMLLPAFATDMPMIPIDIDPPEHADYRRILLPLFTPKNIAKLDEGMHRTARELAEQVAQHEVADVSAIFARPMPTIVFSRLAGFPEDDWPKFDQWVDDIIYERTVNPEKAQKGTQDVLDYFDALLRSREGYPRTDDLMGELMHEGERLGGWRLPGKDDDRQWELRDADSPNPEFRQVCAPEGQDAHGFEDLSQDVGQLLRLFSRHAYLLLNREIEGLSAAGGRLTG